jgi:glycerophosphoryl diester phosphodiesterase
VLGHRGASAYQPEHMLASYQLAIDHLVHVELHASQNGDSRI